MKPNPNMIKVEQQIRALTDAVEKLASHPVAPVAPVLPIAPIAPIIPQYSGDHDLITKLDGKVDNLQNTVDKMLNREDTHVTTVDFVAHLVADNKIHDDQERRMRLIENSVTKILTIGSLGLVLVGMLETVVIHFWH